MDLDALIQANAHAPVGSLEATTLAMALAVRELRHFAAAVEAQTRALDRIAEKMSATSVDGRSIGEEVAAGIRASLEAQPLRLAVVDAKGERKGKGA